MKWWLQHSLTLIRVPNIVVQTDRFQSVLGSNLGPETIYLYWTYDFMLNVLSIAFFRRLSKGKLHSINKYNNRFKNTKRNAWHKQPFKVFSSLQTVSKFHLDSIKLQTPHFHISLRTKLTPLPPLSPFSEALSHVITLFPFPVHIFPPTSKPVRFHSKPVWLNFGWRRKQIHII
jgi:hypothetical protein